MHRVLIIGAGKIGSLIAFLLAQSTDYQVFLADITSEPHWLKSFATIPHLTYHSLDATDEAAITTFVKEKKIEALVSSLPYFQNIHIASVAAALNIHYFDLTEDRDTTLAIQRLANDKSAAFVPQCGLAPGFINIIATELMSSFSELDTVKLRVGALPATTSNALQYALTWSTDGLINEYGNLCQIIEQGQLINALPLEGLEEVNIDGLTYEAFNTSGGIGSLIENYAGKVNNLSYKTIRYPGHCAKMKFLMNDLKLNTDRHLLKQILEQAVPKTDQDVVLVYVSVTGKKQKDFDETNYVRKFYPQTLQNHHWSAIQLTTATEICAIIDLVFATPDHYQGFIAHHRFTFPALIQNRFGRFYA